MKSGEYLFLVIGMALVTYVPRALPAFLIGRMHLGSRTEKFLRMIPYTAMTALIFPGILSVHPGHWWIGLAGGAAAFFLAWKKVPMIACVLATIGTVWLLMTVFGF